MILARRRPNRCSRRKNAAVFVSPCAGALITDPNLLPRADRAIGEPGGYAKLDDDPALWLRRALRLRRDRAILLIDLDAPSVLAPASESWLASRAVAFLAEVQRREREVRDSAASVSVQGLSHSRTHPLGEVVAYAYLVVYDASQMSTVLLLL